MEGSCRRCVRRYGGVYDLSTKKVVAHSFNKVGGALIREENSIMGGRVDLFKVFARKK